MSFYDTLQLDPAVIKMKIDATDDPNDRKKLWIAMTVRAILIVAFAIVFIAPLSAIFGKENSPMAVGIFCILLGTRFVDFGYCIKDSLRNLAIAFFLLFAAPILTSHLNPFFAFLVDFSAFFIILIMICDDPRMGNGAMYGFAYIFLSGNPVSGDLLWDRLFLTILGFLICGAIHYMKHRHKHTNVRFNQVVDKFEWAHEVSRWQIRLALGVSLILCLGRMLGVEEIMWAGFACSSVLSTYPSTADVKEKFYHRIIGVVAGSMLFLIIYHLLPPSLHMLMGPIGGFFLGFCTEYKHKTLLNCFGALMLAAALYGVEGAALLRILDNLMGVVFGYCFLKVYQKFVDKTMPPLKPEATEI